MPYLIVQPDLAYLRYRNGKIAWQWKPSQPDLFFFPIAKQWVSSHSKLADIGHYLENLEVEFDDLGKNKFDDTI